MNLKKKVVTYGCIFLLGFVFFGGIAAGLSLFFYELYINRSPKHNIEQTYGEVIGFGYGAKRSRHANFQYVVNGDTIIEGIKSN